MNKILSRFKFFTTIYTYTSYILFIVSKKKAPVAYVVDKVKELLFIAPDTGTKTLTLTLTNVNSINIFFYLCSKLSIPKATVQITNMYIIAIDSYLNI